MSTEPAAVSALFPAAWLRLTARYAARRRPESDQRHERDAGLDTVDDAAVADAGTG